jgi:hypothetical protein
MLKKLLLLPLLAAIPFHITGCSKGFEYEGTHYDVLGGGTISDTTAIILRRVIDDYYDLDAWGGGGGGDQRLRGFGLNLGEMGLGKIY